MNVSHLEQYLKFNPRLERVYVELFIYYFLGQPMDKVPQETWHYVELVSPLFFSISAVKDAWSTLLHNVGRRGDAYQIAAGGNFHYPAGHDPTGPFAGFPAGIWAMHPQDDSFPKLSDQAFETMSELVELAEANGVEIVFLATPYHAVVDYYFEYVDAWDTVAEWLRRASSIANVVSFSQPNRLVYEPVSRDMVYWWDPFHFSLEMGRMMQLSLIGAAPADLPENFMRAVRPDEVSDLIAERRQGIRRWAEENPEVVEQMNAEYKRWKNGESEIPLHSAPDQAPTDLRGTVKLPSIGLQQFAGAVEFAAVEGRRLRITGWAADIVENAPATDIIVVANEQVLGMGAPSSDRPEIRQHLASNARPAGFDVEILLPDAMDENTGLQVYALFSDGAAARLNADLPDAANGLIQTFAQASMGSAEARRAARPESGPSAALEPAADAAAYPALERFAGAVESAALDAERLRVTGWAADTAANASAREILVVAAGRVIARGAPNLDRPDIRAHVASGAELAGFDLTLTLPVDLQRPDGGFEIYALLQDGSKAQLDSALPEAFIARHSAAQAGQ